MYVIKFSRTGDQSGGSVLTKLQLPQPVVAHADQLTFAVVESTTDERVHQGFDGIRRQ